MRTSRGNNILLKVAKKISKTTGIIYKSSFCLPASSLRTLYYSLVHPYLIYCVSVWASTHPTNLNRIVINSFDFFANLEVKRSSTCQKLLRMAACQNRESSVNDHFSGSLIFLPEIPFSELFSKNHIYKFQRFFFFGNRRKFKNAPVFERFSIRQNIQNLLREPSNGEVLKLLQLTPNLIRHKNNHSYPFLP